MLFDRPLLIEYYSIIRGGKDDKTAAVTARVALLSTFVYHLSTYFEMCLIFR